MGNKYGFWFIAFCFVMLSPVSYAEERPINFEIYPWHIEIEVIGITDRAFRETFVGTGTSEWLRFSLPTGEYRYTARLDEYYNEYGTLSIPGPDENPLVFLTPKSQLATFLDAGSDSFGNPLAFFVLLFSALALVVGAVWGVVWRRTGRWWCDFAAYRREERWKKNPSPTSQELAIKNGVALTVALLLAATARFIILSREPNLNTLTYEQRILIVLLLGIPLYNLARFVMLTLQTLSLIPLRRTWGRVARQLVERSGDIWLYKQPYPCNYKYVTVKSLKTDKFYQIVIDYARGKVSKDFGTQRFYGNTQKFSEQLAVWQKDLEKKRQDVKAEVILLFLPKAEPGKLGSVRTHNNVFCSGNVYVICRNLDDLAECLEGIEASNQGEISDSEHGVKVEEQAVQDLRRFKPEHWKVRRGWLPYMGNIDARLVIPERQDTVIEIKAYKRKPSERNGELIRPNGKSMTDDVAQAKRNAKPYRAKAVLWLPTADPFSFYFDGVLVFGGDALALYRELGAPNSQSAGYSASTAP